MGNILTPNFRGDVVSSGEVFGARTGRVKPSASRRPHKSQDDWIDQLSSLVKNHGFQAFAILDISEIRAGQIYPKMCGHDVDERFTDTIRAVGDISNCSAFLILSETNAPFPFTTGLDCRTNQPPDADLLDDQLDALLNTYGIQGGYCVPVNSPNMRRFVVMFFSVRDEQFTRYPALVLDTIETFDQIWENGAFREESVETGLTEKERWLLTLVARGMSVAEIADEFSMSEFTIGLYSKNVIRKMKCNSLSNAVAAAIKSGLI